MYNKLPNLVKKNPVQTANGGLLVRDCLVTSSPFNYLNDYCKQFTIMMLSLAFCRVVEPCANLESVEFLCSFNLVRLMQCFH